MRMLIFALAALVMVSLLANASFGQADKKKIKPTQHWGGIIEDKEKLKAAPKAGYLTSQDAVDKLWEAWGVKGKAPKLDFKKQIIFVQIASGPNSISTTYVLTNGDLKAVSIQTLKAGPGFGYGIDVVEREGIKTYQGKPLE